MTTLHIENWTALYAATAACCLLAALAAAIAVGLDLYRERAWRDLGTARGAMLFVPRTWWRWQRQYFLGTPVILAVVGLFALSLDW